MLEIPLNLKKKETRFSLCEITSHFLYAPRFDQVIMWVYYRKYIQLSYIYISHLQNHIPTKSFIIGETYNYYLCYHDCKNSLELE